MRKVLFVFAVLALAGVGTARITLLNELSQVHEVELGEVVEANLAVHNPGDLDARVRVYQTDYLFFADGSNVYGDPGTVPRSNAEWITLGASEVTVPAGETLEVRYLVRVPGSSELSGSYWSMIMLEEIAPEEPAAPRNGVAVRAVLRYGVQVVTELGDSGERMLAFVNPELTKTDAGETVLTVEAENRGERMLRSQYYVQLFDEAGALAARVEGDPLRTYPGTSVRQRFAFGVLPEGRYTALVIADSGGEDVFGAQYTLTASSE